MSDRDHASPPGFDSTDGLRILRRYHEATLEYLERRAEVRFIVCGTTGRIVLPVEPGMAAAGELVLHMPDEVERQFQVSMAPKVIERPEAEEVVDRWSAYHAASGTARRPGSRVWLTCEIHGGKCPGASGEVYDADVLMRPNPLRRAEPRLVRMVNASKDRLPRLCSRRARVEVSDPLCVGVDPLGFDVRARFGIVRIEFDLEAGSDEQAEHLIASLLEKC